MLSVSRPGRSLAPAQFAGYPVIEEAVGASKRRYYEEWRSRQGYRFGLVMVKGEPYAIVDIGLRMLTPRELYRAQGFPESYRIDLGADGRPLTKTAQVRMCGNSVCSPRPRG